MLSGVLGNKKKQQAEQLNKRFKDLLSQPGNNVCSDCSVSRPTSAFLLANPVEPGGEALGGFCCSSCYPLFVDLGKDVCVVKSVTIVAGDCKLKVNSLELLNRLRFFFILHLLKLPSL